MAKLLLAFIKNLGIVVPLMITSLSLTMSAPVTAQGINIPCIPPARPPTLAAKLAEEIPEYVGGESSVPRGPFFQNRATIEIVGNAMVCIASSPDGLGALKVDDQLELTVGDDHGLSDSWVYDFYDQRNKGVIETRSQDVSRLFAPGNNIVRITLRDLKPPTYSTRPIWLVIWQVPTPIPTRSATPTSIIIFSTPTPTATPSPAPSITPTFRGTSVPPSNMPTVPSSTTQSISTHDLVVIAIAVIIALIIGIALLAKQ